MSSRPEPWLVAIDLQRVFADPGSPWATPRFAEVLPRVDALVAAYAGRVVFTRFVPPAVPEGSWADYYAQWSFALAPESAPGWALVPDPDAAPVVTRPTMGKYGADLLAATGGVRDLDLCGVSTDCCVLSTALAAADDGARVRVAADACAGASDADHRRSLEAMAFYAPQIEVLPTADLLAG